MNLAKNIARSIVSPLSTRITDFVGGIVAGGGGGFLPTYPGAAGAYSLRSLTGKSSTSVVRLRRASDSAESDFNADELTNGTAEAWSQSGDAFATTWYDQSASNEQAIEDPNIQDVNAWSSTSTATEINVGSLVLEKVDTSSQIIRSEGVLPKSTYKVEIDYANTSTKSNAFRCYVGGSTGAVLFPSGSGTISQIYAASASSVFTVQSISSADIGDELTITRISFIDIGKPATQTTADAQPKLITAGVTELENGKPALVFDGVDDELSVGSIGVSGSDNRATFSVVTPNVYGVTGGGYLGADSGVPGSSYDHCIESGLFALRVQGNSTYADAANNLTQRLWTTNLDGTTAFEVELFKDGASIARTSGVDRTLSTVDDWFIGATPAQPDANYDGNIQEIIIYPSDQSANRTGIETNINDHYGIY